MISLFIHNSKRSVRVVALCNVSAGPSTHIGHRRYFPQSCSSEESFLNYEWTNWSYRSASVLCMISLDQGKKVPEGSTGYLKKIHIWEHIHRKKSSLVDIHFKVNVAKQNHWIKRTCKEASRYLFLKLPCRWMAFWNLLRNQCICTSVQCRGQDKRFWGRTYLCRLYSCTWALCGLGVNLL